MLPLPPLLLLLLLLLLVLLLLLQVPLSRSRASRAGGSGKEEGVVAAREEVGEVIITAEKDNLHQNKETKTNQ